MTYNIEKSAWKTVYDLDFTTQSTQSISTNGNYTIGGKTWVKSSSASDAVAMALTNGTGLVIQPVSASDITSGTRNAPLLRLPFSQLDLPKLSWSSKVRLWVYVSADNVAADFHNTIACIDDNSAVREYVAMRGRKSAGADGFIARSILNTTNSDVTLAIALATGNRVMVIDLDGLVASRYSLLVGQVNSGNWPDPRDLKLVAHTAPLGSSTGNVFDNDSAPTLMGISLGAARGGSGTSFSTTIAKVRVDFKF